MPAIIATQVSTFGDALAGVKKFNSLYQVSHVSHLSSLLQFHSMHSITTKNQNKLYFHDHFISQSLFPLHISLLYHRTISRWTCSRTRSVSSSAPTTTSLRAHRRGDSTARQRRRARGQRAAQRHILQHTWTSSSSLLEIIIKLRGMRLWYCLIYWFTPFSSSFPFLFHWNIKPFIII